MGSVGWAWLQVDFKYQWNVVSLDISSRIVTNSWHYRFADIEVRLIKSYVDNHLGSCSSYYFSSFGLAITSTDQVLDQLTPMLCAQLRVSTHPMGSTTSSFLARLARS